MRGIVEEPKHTTLLLTGQCLLAEQYARNSQTNSERSIEQWNTAYITQQGHRCALQSKMCDERNGHFDSAVKLNEEALLTQDCHLGFLLL